MILSLDQSINSTGFIVWDERGAIHSFGALRKPKDIEDPVKQLNWVIGKTRELLDNNSVTQAIIEGLPFGMQSTSVRILAALFFMIMKECDDKGIPCAVIPPSEVKKAAGSGKLSKDEVIASLPEQVLTMVASAGYKKTTGLSDIADAYFIYQAFRIRESKSKFNF